MHCVKKNTSLLCNLYKRKPCILDKQLLLCGSVVPCHTVAKCKQGYTS